MAICELSDSEPIGKQFAQSDIYDGARVILNQSRIPCSVGKGKDNAREGKGARFQGQRREGNLENGGGQSGEGGNYQLQEEFANWEEDNYQDIWGGGVRPRMFSIRGEMLRPHVI